MRLENEEDSVIGNVFPENAFEDNENTDKRYTKKRKYESIPGSEPQKRKSKNELYKPPTVEELNNLKETENLYNNNLFRLQIDELISEVNIKNKRKKELSSWVNKFQSFLDTLPEYELMLSSIHMPNERKSKLEKFISKLRKYDPFGKTDQDLSIKLKKPSNIRTFGLYEINCLPGPNAILKINLEMPKEYFLTKDFLNNRYYTKRFYYLLYILEHLKLTEIVDKVSLSYHENNVLIPILEIVPPNCSKCAILIYATPAEHVFKVARFLPEQNNVKLDLFSSNIDNDTLKDSPTIFYNSTIAHDVTLALNNNFIQEMLVDIKNVQEGIKLLCIWSKQRELDLGTMSFTETLIVYFIVYLLEKRKINKYMSSYQVIRNFWNFIGNSDLQNVPIGLNENNTKIINTFKNNFDVVFLDKTGCYNLTAFITKEIYVKIKSECQFALKCLDSNKNNSFQQLFLTKICFHLQYDFIIDLSFPLKNNFDISETDKALYIGFENLLIVNFLVSTLHTALDKRIVNIVPKLVSDGKQIKSLVLGVNLNPEEAFNFLQKGPPLNELTAAAKFRKFWSHLSSDRRFRDGSTNVAVHFKTNTIKGRRNIIKKILNYIFNEKLGLQYNLHYDEFEEVLISKKVVPSYPSGTNEETTLKIIHASDDLGKKLRALEMSLKITGVQGISDVFTFSEVFPPIPTNYKVGQNVTTTKGDHLIFQTNKKIGLIPRYVQPIVNVLQLEHSTKWPNNLEALLHIKTAFYLEISKKLSGHHQIISHVTPDYLEVYYEGLVFRYLLNVPKEMGLIKKEAAEDGLTRFRESKESINMDKKLNILPKVIGALKGIQSLYPSYGPGTALIKKWMRSQLIDEHLFPDVAINLINASLYLDSTVIQANTPQKSFIRFLKYFSEFDWNLQTICVPFNEEDFENELTEIESNLQKNRTAFPNLYIIMPYDQGLSVFTKESPTKETIYRVKQLAKESFLYIENLINYPQKNIKDLFVPNMEGYNILIHLRPLLNPRRHEELVLGAVESRIIVEKYKASPENKLPITDFNPVEKYLKSLRENYGKYAIFFHNSYGGNVIGVLWKPAVFQTVEFKVNQVNAKQFSDNKLCFNMDAVIEDFYIIGKDLVKSIEKK